MMIVNVQRTSLLIPLTLVWLLAGCSLGRPPAPTAPELALPNLQAPAIEQVTYTVQRGDVAQKVEFESEVSLAVTEDLFFAAPGRIRKTHVQSGDFVEEGDLIAELDTRDFDFALQEAQLDLALAQQRLDEAKNAVDYLRQRAELDLEIAELRLDEYSEAENSSAQELDIRRRQVEQARLVLERIDAGTAGVALGNGTLPDMQRLETDLARAELRLERLAAELSDAQIVAPFAGEVQLYPELTEGKGAQAYESMARLVDPNSFIITSSLVREDMEKLYEGMPVTIRMPNRPGASDSALTGTIATLPQPFGRGVDTVTVVELDDASLMTELRPGAEVQVVAPIDIQEATLWLPPVAVRGFGENRFVLAESASGGIQETPVTVGVSNREQIQLLDGAFEGMTVIGQ